MSRFEPLSLEDERRLLKLARCGDEGARNQFAEANLRFAFAVARSYASCGVPFEDLVGAANLGLAIAAQRFEGLNNALFVTYASWWVHREVLRLIRLEQQFIRLPGHVDQQVNLLYKVSERLQQQFGRIPTLAELADESGLSSDHVFWAITSAPDTKGLYVGDIGGPKVIFCTDPAEEAADSIPGVKFDTMSEGDLVNRILRAVSGRSLEVVVCHYGLDGRPQESLAQIGRRMKLSREMVRKIRNNALRCLRESAEAYGHKSIN